MMKLPRLIAVECILLWMLAVAYSQGSHWAGKEIRDAQRAMREKPV